MTCFPLVRIMDQDDKEELLAFSAATKNRFYNVLQALVRSNL